MLTLTLDNKESDVQWGENFFVLFFTVVISSAIYYSSSDLGRRLGPMPDPMAPAEPPPKEADNYWLPDERPAAVRAAAIPLVAEPAPSARTATAPAKDPEAWRESMQALDKILARVQAKQAAT